MMPFSIKIVKEWQVWEEKQQIYLYASWICDMFKLFKYFRSVVRYSDVSKRVGKFDHLCTSQKCSYCNVLQTILRKKFSSVLYRHQNWSFIITEYACKRNKKGRAR